MPPKRKIKATKTPSTTPQKPLPGASSQAKRRNSLQGAKTSRLAPSEDFHMTTRRAANTASNHTSSGVPSIASDSSRRSSLNGFAHYENAHSENEDERPAKRTRLSTDSSSPRISTGPYADQLAVNGTQTPDTENLESQPAVNGSKMSNKKRRASDESSQSSKTVSARPNGVLTRTQSDTSELQPRRKKRKTQQDAADIAEQPPDLTDASTVPNSPELIPEVASSQGLNHVLPTNGDVAGKLGRRLPGRRRAPHPDVNIETALRRQLNLKMSYRTLAKVQKSILEELSNRSTYGLENDPDYHKHAPEYKPLMAALDQYKKRRLGQVHALRNNKLEQLDRVRIATEHIENEKYIQRMQELQEDLLLQCFYRMKQIEREMKGEEGCATDDEDNVIAPTHIEFPQIGQDDRLGSKYASRSRAYVEADYLLEEELQKKHFDQVRKAFVANDEDADDSIDDAPRSFARFTGPGRTEAVAHWNIMSLIDAAVDVEHAPVQPVQVPLPLKPVSEERIDGLSLLASLAADAPRGVIFEETANEQESTMPTLEEDVDVGPTSLYREASPVEAYPPPEIPISVDNAPIIAPRVEEIPVDNAPIIAPQVEEFPVDNAPNEALRVPEVSVDNAPIIVPQVQEIPVDNAPIIVPQVQEFPVDNTPNEAPHIQEVSVDNTPNEALRVPEVSVDNIPNKAPQVQEVSGGSIPLPETNGVEARKEPEVPNNETTTRSSHRIMDMLNDDADEPVHNAPEFQPSAHDLNIAATPSRRLSIDQGGTLSRSGPLALDSIVHRQEPPLDRDSIVHRQEPPHDRDSSGTQGVLLPIPNCAPSSSPSSYRYVPDLTPRMPSYTRGMSEEFLRKRDPLHAIRAMLDAKAISEGRVPYSQRPEREPMQTAALPHSRPFSPSSAQGKDANTASGGSYNASPSAPPLPYNQSPSLAPTYPPRRNSQDPASSHWEHDRRQSGSQASQPAPQHFAGSPPQPYHSELNKSTTTSLTHQSPYSTHNTPQLPSIGHTLPAKPPGPPPTTYRFAHYDPAPPRVVYPSPTSSGYSTPHRSSSQSWQYGSGYSAPPQQVGYVPPPGSFQAPPPPSNMSPYPPLKIHQYGERQVLPAHMGPPTSSQTPRPFISQAGSPPGYSPPQQSVLPSRNPSYDQQASSNAPREESSERPPDGGPRPRRQYRSYHAPGTQFRTYQGPDSVRRRGG